MFHLVVFPSLPLSWRCSCYSHTSDCAHGDKCDDDIWILLQDLPLMEMYSQTQSIWDKMFSWQTSNPWAESKTFKGLKKLWLSDNPQEMTNLLDCYFTVLKQIRHFRQQFLQWASNALQIKVFHKSDTNMSYTNWRSLQRLTNKLVISTREKG